MPPSCDIFCTVVDNYGDIGVCWRLARQLAQEHGCTVRLWVDDMASFVRLCPEADAASECRHCRGVEVRRWTPTFTEVEPAQFVIAAFACKLPPDYVERMARQADKPVWINLEYLSAEAWVEGCHKLPSPHSTLPLVKYFFFPGFTPKTGGLLREKDLLERRDAFKREGDASDATRVSLFCYENTALPDLLHVWEQAAEPVRCLMPEGCALPQVADFFGQPRIAPGDVLQRGNLTLQVLPFVEQERYDELLWACDVNFVRGEDSFVRAQWAAHPFVWQIYPQDDGAHQQKLRAFLARFCAGLPADAAQAVSAVWEGWNGGRITADAWREFIAHRSLLRQHGLNWAAQQARNNLARNVLDFYWSRLAQGKPRPSPQ